MVPDGSLVRVAIVPEVVIGTPPATPTFQVQRYQNSDLKPSKQTETPDEVRPDGNATAPVDVGQTVGGTISGLFSYGTDDLLLANLFRSAWATNQLVNGITHGAFTIEEFFEQGAVDTFLRYPGCRVNTLDLTIEAQKSVDAKFGIMGLQALAPATAIIAGATYTAPTTTEVFNAALNVAALTVTGITNNPVIQKLALKISSNIYANNAVGIRGTYSHGYGLFTVEGSLSAYFENQDTYKAVVDHTTVGITFTLTDAAGNSYAFLIPKAKLMDGGPTKPGNGKAVMVDIPFKAFIDPTISGTMKITRTPAP
jgi:hypothetical protein